MRLLSAVLAAASFIGLQASSALPPALVHVPAADSLAVRVPSTWADGSAVQDAVPGLQVHLPRGASDGQPVHAVLMAGRYPLCTVDHVAAGAAHSCVPTSIAWRESPCARDAGCDLHVVLSAGQGARPATTAATALAWHEVRALSAVLARPAVATVSVRIAARPAADAGVLASPAAPATLLQAASGPAFPVTPSATPNPVAMTAGAVELGTATPSKLSYFSFSVTSADEAANVLFRLFEYGPADSAMYISYAVDTAQLQWPTQQCVSYNHQGICVQFQVQGFNNMSRPVGPNELVAFDTAVLGDVLHFAVAVATHSATYNADFGVQAVVYGNAGQAAAPAQIPGGEQISSFATPTHYTDYYTWTVDLSGSDLAVSLRTLSGDGYASVQMGVSATANPPTSGAHLFKPIAGVWVLYAKLSTLGQACAGTTGTCTVYIGVTSAAPYALDVQQEDTPTNPMDLEPNWVSAVAVVNPPHPLYFRGDVPDHEQGAIVLTFYVPYGYPVHVYANYGKNTSAAFPGTSGHGALLHTLVTNSSGESALVIRPHSVLHAQCQVGCRMYVTVVPVGTSADAEGLIFARLSTDGEGELVHQAVGAAPVSGMAFASDPYYAMVSPGVNSFWSFGDYTMDVSDVAPEDVMVLVTVADSTVYPIPLPDPNDPSSYLWMSSSASTASVTISTSDPSRCRTHDCVYVVAVIQRSADDDGVQFTFAAYSDVLPWPVDYLDPEVLSVTAGSCRYLYVPTVAGTEHLSWFVEPLFGPAVTVTGTSKWCPTCGASTLPNQWHPSQCTTKWRTGQETGTQTLTAAGTGSGCWKQSDQYLTLGICAPQGTEEIAYVRVQLSDTSPPSVRLDESSFGTEVSVPQGEGLYLAWEWSATHRDMEVFMTVHQGAANMFVSGNPDVQVSGAAGHYVWALDADQSEDAASLIIQHNTPCASKAPYVTCNPAVAWHNGTWMAMLNWATPKQTSDVRAIAPAAEVWVRLNAAGKPVDLPDGIATPVITAPEPMCMTRSWFTGKCISTALPGLVQTAWLSMDLGDIVGTGSSADAGTLLVDRMCRDATTGELSPARSSICNAGDPHSTVYLAVAVCSEAPCADSQVIYPVPSVYFPGRHSQPSMVFDGAMQGTSMGIDLTAMRASCSGPGCQLFVGAFVDYSTSSSAGPADGGPAAELQFMSIRSGDAVTLPSGCVEVGETCGLGPMELAANADITYAVWAGSNPANVKLVVDMCRAGELDLYVCASHSSADACNPYVSPGPNNNNQHLSVSSTGDNSPAQAHLNYAAQAGVAYVAVSTTSAGGQGYELMVQAGSAPLLTTGTAGMSVSTSATALQVTLPTMFVARGTTQPSSAIGLRWLVAAVPTSDLPTSPVMNSACGVDVVLAQVDSEVTVFTEANATTASLDELDSGVEYTLMAYAVCDSACTAGVNGAPLRAALLPTTATPSESAGKQNDGHGMPAGEVVGIVFGVLAAVGAVAAFVLLGGVNKVRDMWHARQHSSEQTDSLFIGDAGHYSQL